jgi:hypothetical protein
MFRAFRAMAREPESRVLLLAAALTLTVGTVGYMLLEHWTPIQALYFCVVTLATVGYGDLHPTTEIAQLFTVLYVITGVGILAAFITEVARHRPMIAAGVVRAAQARSGQTGGDADEASVD